MTIDPSYIRSLFARPLPGEEAHSTLLIYQRPLASEVRKRNPAPRESAVIMLIFPKGGKWCTLFIVRPDYGGIHSSQLSFPGGKREQGDTDLLATALRETQEETGIDGSRIQIIGQLSELFIPPSNFTVLPFVGLLVEEPEFSPNYEVAELLVEPFEFFFKEPAVINRKIFLPQYKITVTAPCFDVQGHTLWGATAMMVQELRYMAGFIK
ncbi:MAG: CoA pyrophosphatase [Crocinitomicaceae bacterium]|nr:CoA pyrophosphatase [Crocinitomicaceae bacterium]